MADRRNPSGALSPISFLVGLDVGSTTVKGVVVAADGGPILWRDYRRHDTRQAEVLCAFLRRMEQEAGIAPGNCRIFLTGSGGHALTARWARALCRRSTP